MANEKRFNVAITRAKALLIAVGNPRVLETDKINWLPFLRYCRNKGAWAGEDDWVESVDTNNDISSDCADSENEEWDLVQDFEAMGYINREE